MFLSLFKSFLSVWTRPHLWCYQGGQQFQKSHCWPERESRNLIENSRQVNKKIRTDFSNFIENLVARKKQICENWRSEFDIEFKVRQS